MISNLLALGASIFTIWTVFRYFILIEIRIDENYFKIIYEKCKDDNRILVEEEFTHEKKYPIVFSAICRIKDAPIFYINHQERLLTAGWVPKDYVTKIVLFRTKYKKFKNFLLNCHKKNTNIPVDLLIPYSSDKIGHIKSNPNPIIENKLCYDFESDIENKVKTSAIFYGNPGNGKTTFIKYLACKYNLSIKIITFSPEWSNYELLLLFSQIPNDCIVLFEDFDNYFHERKCIIGEDNKNIKFTFDVVLNALDGIYNTYENVVFIMTVNDISKVDVSLKQRPSRFKYCIEFDNPSSSLIEKIFGKIEGIEKVQGMNLDQILTIKNHMNKGISLEEAIDKIPKK
jgi:hypothetical protein